MTSIISITPVQSDLTDNTTVKLFDVEFKADVDESSQRYVEMLPKDFQPAKHCDILITLHGHGSDRWQCFKPQNFKACRDFAVRHEMIMVSPDYRASTSWMGPKAEADLLQIIALLRKKYRVRKVFLYGGSMGGTSVLIFSALHPELAAGVSSINGTANMLEYQNFQDAIAASYGGNKQQKPEEYRKRSPELVPEKFSMPVAFVVGGQDAVVPPDSVRRLAKRLRKMKREVLLIDRKDTAHTSSYEDAAQALEFMFKGSGRNAESGSTE